jgi:hypothetical protein
MEEGYGIPIGTHCDMSEPQEVSRLSFTLHLSPCTRKQLSHRLHQAYARGALRLVKRLQALLALAEDMTVSAVAAMWALGEPTVRDYRHQFLGKGVASLVSQRPPGRPSQLTNTPRRELAHLITAGPQAAG